MTLHLTTPRNSFAPYFVEEIRQYLERTYGTAAVHEQGLRVYTTLNVAMQRSADQAVLDGLHEYDRRHGWRGGLRNIVKEGVARKLIATIPKIGTARSRRAITSPDWFARSIIPRRP